MHTITAQFTDENGRKRAGRFWVQGRDVEYERTRFESAGYKVEFNEYHWIIATRTDDNKEKIAIAEWVMHKDLDAMCKDLHERDFDILVFEAPGKRLQQHILTKPQTREGE